MKRLFVTIILLTVPASVLAVPALSRAQAESVLAAEYAGQPLYWQPVQLPALVPDAAVSPDAQLLVKLAELDVLTRESRMEMRDLGDGRSRVGLNWLYRWPQPEHDGIFYGIRRIASGDKGGSVVNQGDGWFADVSLTWFVTDMPLWTEHPDLAGIRLLRRSRESREKPFETGVALEYRDAGWHVWHP